MSDREPICEDVRSGLCVCGCSEFQQLLLIEICEFSKSRTRFGSASCSAVAQVAVASGPRPVGQQRNKDL